MVREGTAAYIDHHDRGEWELYDLATDPHQLASLATTDPADVAAWAAKADGLRAATVSPSARWRSEAPLSVVGQRPGSVESPQPTGVAGAPGSPDHSQVSWCRSVCPARRGRR